MARIISTKPIGAFNLVCPKCCYEVEFVPSDINESTGGWEMYGDRIDPYRYVMCHGCRKRIDLPIPSLYDDYDI